MENLEVQKLVQKTYYIHSNDIAHLEEVIRLMPNYDTKSVKKLVIDFAKKPENRILLLWGENGTGKSHLGSGITFECGGKFITSTLLCVEYESGSDY